MHPKRKQTLMLLLCGIAGLAIVLGLVLYALQQNINLFFTPTDVVQEKTSKQYTFRLGGLVKQGSVKRSKKDLDISFVLSDTLNEVIVSYHGILPDLFKEGQGIVAQGHLLPNGTFKATEVLAKHDANYMPPNVKDALQKAAVVRALKLKQEKT